MVQGRRTTHVLMAAALVGFAGPALAGGHGCASRECFEKVRQPDTYATVERPVVVRPGYAEVVHTPPVVHERIRRIESVPGTWHSHREPAVYGSYTRTVMVRPARTVHDHIPAVTRMVAHTEVVRPARVTWQRQVDSHGRETMCKVVVPAQTRAVHRNVIVSGPRRISRTIPAEFRQVSQPMLIQPARNINVYQPPVHSYVREPMVIRPATATVVHHAPVVAVERHDVLVKRGGHAWVPMNRHW